MPVQELLWQGDLVAAVQCNERNSTSLVHAGALLFSPRTKSEHKNAQLKTCSPSVVLLLFLLMNATVPGLVSSEPSTELLLITLSSSFFPVTSAAAASSSSSSSWSEYWLKASTSSLKTSSLIKPPSGTQLTCQCLTSANSLNVFPQASRNAKEECCSDIKCERGSIMGSVQTSQRDSIQHTPLSPWTPS